MYTNQQIQEAWDRYSARINPVREILGSGPLNQHRVNTVVHSGDRFMVVEWLRQQMAGGILWGSYSGKIRVCQELILQKNKAMPEDIDLTPIYAGSPLDAEANPFFMVSYHDKVWDYVLANAITEREFTAARLMRTRKDISFILARENDVNSDFPFEAVFK